MISFKKDGNYYVTILYNQYLKKGAPYEAKTKLMLVTVHKTMDALEFYLRDIDAVLPEDYSHLFEEIQDKIS